MLNRALACALEKLAPFYRDQMVRELARALAADGGQGLDYLAILNAGEIRRAHRMAAAMRAQRDAALLARRFASIITFVRRLTDLICRRNI